MAGKDKDLIACCGLYCGDCLNHKGEIADMARDLRKKLRETKFDRVAVGLSKYFKEFNDYEQAYAVMGAMVRLRCKRACRNGGGNPSCKIRTCCRKKGLNGCWECAEYEACAKFESLEPIHNDANLKNLKKINQDGIDSFLRGKRAW